MEATACAMKMDHKVLWVSLDSHDNREIKNGSGAPFSKVRVVTGPKKLCLFAVFTFKI